MGLGQARCCRPRGALRAAARCAGRGGLRSGLESGPTEVNGVSLAGDGGYHSDTLAGKWTDDIVMACFNKGGVRILAWSDVYIGKNYDLSLVGRELRNKVKRHDGIQTL